MLDRAGNTGRDIKLWPNGFPGLADLSVRGDPALLDQWPRAAIFGAKHVRELLYQLEVLRRSQTEPSSDDHVGIGKVGLCRIAVREERQHFVTISSSTSPSGCEMTRQTAPVTRSGIGITRGRTVAICGR